MAQLIIPLEEAIRVFQASVQLPPIVRRVEPTAQGPRVVLRLSPLMREFGVTIRLLRYDGSAAHFALDGMPNFLNLNTMLKPPEGIAFNGDRMTIQPAALLGQIGVRGLSVTGVTFEVGAYHLTLSA